MRASFGRFRMPYVITRLCIDCVDRGCVDVCPVECIYEPKDAPTLARPNMLYIHPTECIACGACEPECPWQAIYEDRELPAALQADVAVNAETEQHPSAFRVAKPERDEAGRVLKKARPTADQVRQNRAKWSIE
jgi:ferredoxin